MDIDAKQRNKILLLLFVGVLMGALDIAIVGPAFPAIQAEFAVGSRQMAWIFNIYVLVSLISTPLMAKLSDRFGRRSIYILDVALFVSGSLVVASARSEASSRRLTVTFATRLPTTARMFTDAL